MSVRDLALGAFAASGLAAAARRLLAAGGRFVVTFHGVAARRRPELPAEAQPAFCAAELRAALAWIGRRFRFLTPEEALAGDRGGVLLTFDDGFANQRRSALPVLEEHAAPAVFFVTTRHVAAPRDWLPATRAQARLAWPRDGDVPDDAARDLFDGMTRGELLECAEHPLITIGSHTLSHPFLTRLDDAALARELGDSKRLLEDWTGRPVELLAYPTGDYDHRVARAARDAGYRAAFAEDPVGAGLDAWEIPRVGLYDAAPAYLAAKLSGLHRRPWRGRVPS